MGKAFKDIADELNSPLSEIRRRLGDEGADKANAILAILQIGKNRSVAYSKAILAATEMALERASCILEQQNFKTDD